MICLACLVSLAPGSGLCGRCRAQLPGPPPERSVAGLVVRSAYVHEGSARVLVRRLKYEGMPAAASVLARAMATHLPAHAAALVPVPRVLWRRIRLGVDPAPELAAALSMETGVAVWPVLQAPLWWPPRAGRNRTAHRPPPFSNRALPPPGSILIDDVCTTGGTLAAAARVLGDRVRSALTATAAAGTMKSRPLRGISGARERA